MDKNMFCKVEEAIEILQRGQILIVTDDEDRENEGDFLMAAEYATPEKINFMMKHGRGLICAPTSVNRAKVLNLYQMVEKNEDEHTTAFTVSIDGVGTGTGISASNRSKTIMMMADDQVGPKDFHRPGHIFPLVAKDGGVIERPGHTEATLDLMKISGLKDAGVICEIIKEDGEMARMPDLEVFADQHNMKILTIQTLIEYMKALNAPVQKLARTKLPTDFAEFDMIAFENEKGEQPHLALVLGDVEKTPPLIRIHSECMTGDVFGSKRCDCGQQLNDSMKAIAEEGSGILIYLRQEGRGIGLVNKLRAYALQDQGLDTVDANTKLGFSEDEREYDQAIKMLEDLGVRSLRLMTNNPLKLSAFDGTGIDVVRCDSLQPVYVESNKDYLNTKVERMGHLYAKQV